MVKSDSHIFCHDNHGCDSYENRAGISLRL
jgi:hypothetical protein